MDTKQQELYLYTYLITPKVEAHRIIKIISLEEGGSITAVIKYNAKILDSQEITRQKDSEKEEIELQYSLENEYCKPNKNNLDRIY